MISCDRCLHPHKHPEKRVCSYFIQIKYEREPEEDCFESQMFELCEDCENRFERFLNKVIDNFPDSLNWGENGS